MIYIGLDTGAKTGFAVWDSDAKEFTRIETLDFWTAYDIIADAVWKTSGYDKTPTIVIELPARFIYSTHSGANRNTAINIATKYGGTRREAELLAARFEAMGFKVITQQPKKGGKTKMKADAFKRLTGYEGRTNEHGRDAAMLVFGR